MSNRLTLVLTIMMSVSALSQAEKPLRFDATWWQHANSDEQQGFIYGYMDCRLPPNPSNASIVEYQNAVSVSMKDQKATDPNAVTKAIEHAWTTLRSRDIRGGEKYSKPNGFLDGEWWGGFEGRPWPPNIADADRATWKATLNAVTPL